MRGFLYLMVFSNGKISRFNGKFFQFTELLFSAEITFLKTEKYGVSARYFFGLMKI